MSVVPFLLALAPEFEPAPASGIESGQATAIVLLAALFVIGLLFCWGWCAVTCTSAAPTRC